MTEIDKALIAAQDGSGTEGDFYNAFLNSEILIPLIEPAGEDGSLKPILIEADGKLHLMLFDTEERLGEWAKKEIDYAGLPGHEVVRMMDAGTPWMLNVGTEHPKMFVPDEIQWLKDSIEKAGAEPE